jgi:hypothetical protein
LPPEQRAENERLGYNWHRQQYIHHPTNIFEIAAIELGSKYELATIADSRTAAIETKVGV